MPESLTVVDFVCYPLLRRPVDKMLNNDQVVEISKFDCIVVNKYTRSQ